ncbi:hypothetical protein J4Q44_G00190460 [Coregonus suidteri]|uniref:DRBM domain-containing protein n=1 Tax=Coregonus suidteri TaxID=861788 RepID=A0AAN8LUT8_9TELE
MDSLRRFQDDGYKNWIKTTMGLNCLKTRLGGFLENETETYHCELRKKVNIKLNGAMGNPMCNQIPKVCKEEVCEQWKVAILANHKGGPVYWNNSNPYLWPTKKWEVAKVHMNGGNGKHTTVEEFDISAFLNLMSHCLHFRKFAKPNLFTPVTNVRNKVMHSADFRVERKNLELYLGRIKELGRALETHSPELRELAEEIEQLQNTDFSFIVNQFGKNRAEGKAAGNAADEGKIFEDMQKLQKFLSLEQQILKEKMECLTQRYEEDRETALTVDELQCVRVFLEGNKDLQESLGPQWEKLREVQEKVDLLNNRVDTLERNTHTHDPEFATEVLRYKNHLYEEANMQGWRPPVFSEIKEGLGFRGCVKVRGLTFEGTKVCGNLKASHQEVAKLALQHLSQLASDSASLSELANDTEEGEVASSQTDQPQSLSCTGPMFFGCVTVVLKTDVTSGERHSGKTEAVEFAYKKLALLLDLPESASPYKDVVLEHCHTQDVPPPEEALQSDAERRSYHCTLRFTGPITFYAPEGSRKKKPVQQQAAKVALQRLSWVLGSKEVVGGNYVSALKELLEAQTPPLEMPDYDVTDRGEGAGEVTERGGGVEESEGMTSEIEKGGIGKKEKGVWPDEGEGCPHIPPAPVIPSLQPPESQVVPVSAMDTSVTMDPMDTMVTMDTVVAIDTTVTMNTMETQGGGALESDPRQATPTLPEERSVFSDSRRFFACVTVYVQKDLIPQEASTQEGALQAAYCSLLQGLSLELPPTAGSERQSVLEFFRLAESDPPVEDCVTTAEGKHRCTLGIVGELTFHSPEAAPKKQQAEHWAAKEALRRLSGILSGVVGSSGAGLNYKGNLQELLVKHGGGAKPEYKNSTGAVAGQVTGETSDYTLQADKLSVSVAVAMETTPEDSGPPPPKRSAEMKSGGETEEIRRCLVRWDLQPPCVVCEDVSVEQWCEWRVEVRLDRYTFHNQTLFSSKKEAIRRSYHSLGTTGEICQPGTDESQSMGKVKQFFLQRSFPLPVEDVKEQEKGRFCCTLKHITCVFTYSGQGSSEAAARQSACQRALSQLAPFIGNCGPVAPTGSTEKAVQRLQILLEGAGLTSANSALTGTQYRSSIQLRFSGYSMETRGQGNKKTIRAQLIQRLLGLLGEDEMDSSRGTSVRNVLDEWFVKRGLEKPGFEENTSGTKVTFSTPLLCSYTDWQASKEKSQKRLVEELQRRVKYLYDGSTN